MTDQLPSDVRMSGFHGLIRCVNDVSKYRFTPTSKFQLQCFLIFYLRSVQNIDYSLQYIHSFILHSVAHLAAKTSPAVSFIRNYLSPKFHGLHYLSTVVLSGNQCVR